AVSPPRDIDPHSAKQLSQISTEAVRRVRAEIWPSLVTPNDVHDALVTGGFLTSPELSGAQSSLNTLRDQRRADEINVTEHAPSIWVAAERINLFSAIHPGLRARVLPPRGYDEALEPTQALERLVRSRLQLVGPTTASMLAKPLGLAPTQVLQTLTKLQAEGFVFAGRFDASVPTDEQQWCERRLLARMHRYAMAERRRSVRPVTASLFMRFLFRWHGFDGPIPTGDQRLFDVLQQLEAFGAPAGNWETDLLNRRVPHYEPGGLDALCLSGRIGWLRLRATDAHGGGGLLNATPIGFSARRRLRDWRTIADDVELSSDAATLRAALEDGPVFLSDLLDDTGLLPAQIERGLSELARHGLATSDSFSGLRALLPRKSGRPRMSARAARRRSSDELEAAGRWSLVTRPGTPREDHVEYAATVLLRRYGIVFRALLDREAAMPAWSELRTAFRQMESAGEVRGGRFVSGFAGEQFASAEAIKVLNALKRQTPTGRRIGISAADPLNLIGIILPGEKVPSSSKATLWFQDGLPREDGNSNHNNGSVGVGPQTVGRPRFAGFVRSRTT
ncbi:MAG: ATP-dependent DNA helicase, partial [Pseudomonadota bacterium]